jgi:hypothetical protein
MQLEAICHVCLMLPGKPGLRSLQSAIYTPYHAADMVQDAQVIASATTALLRCANI